MQIGRVWHEMTRQSRQPQNQNQVYNWPAIIQKLVFPPTCLLCGDRGERTLDLCRKCLDSLPFLHEACPRCGLPLTASTASSCGACLKNPPPFHRMTCTFRYEEPIRHLIQSLKFGSGHAHARLLGTLLADSIHLARPLPEAVIPVPLHPRRYAERSFNQSLEMARIVSAHLRIPLDYNTCRRMRSTEAQARLHSGERRRNIRRAFVVSPDFRYKHIALLDDVVTTGATVSELATELRKAGADQIDIWTCARALP